MAVSSLLPSDGKGPSSSTSLCHYLSLPPKQDKGVCRKGTDAPEGSSHGQGDDHEVTLWQTLDVQAGLSM